MTPRLSAAAVALACLPVAVACRSAGAKPSDRSGRAASAAPAPLVRFVGRFDRRDPAGPRFAWPGSAVETSFDGTGLDVRLRDEGTNYFAVVVDGGAARVLPTRQGVERYPLVSGLIPGVHTVRLVKKTEAKVGTVQLLGFEPQGGALVAREAPPRKLVEFVGDSLTCGYGVLGTDPNQHFLPELEDETAAYASLASAALGVEHTSIAASGQGVYRNFRGETADQLPVLFRRTLPGDASSRWTFDGPRPDAVVVNLGTNDFARGDPGPAFDEAYRSFVRAIRAAYPAAEIVCAVSGSLTDLYPFNAQSRTKASAAIRRVVDDLRNAGDDHVHYFAFAEQNASDGFGSDYHPSARAQQRLAEQLVPYLRPLLGIAP